MERRTLLLAVEFFITAGKDFLTSVILHCLCSDWPEKSLPGCRKFLAQTDPTDPENAAYIYDMMLRADHGSEQIHQHVIEGAGNQRKRADKEGASVLSTVNNALAVFADAKIRRNTGNSEFYIDEFEKTNVPITLYSPWGLIRSSKPHTYKNFLWNEAPCRSAAGSYTSQSSPATCRG
jgi:type IV secretory pathway TraG/TraD family ATPase VirD4